MKERLPSLTAKKVLRALDRAGFVQARTSGSHVRLLKESDPTRAFTVTDFHRLPSAGLPAHSSTHEH